MNILSGAVSKVKNKHGISTFKPTLTYNKVHHMNRTALELLEGLLLKPF